MSPIARQLKRRPRQPSQSRLRPDYGQPSGLYGRQTQVEYLEDRRLLTVVPFATLATDLRGDLHDLESRIVNSLNDFATGQNSSLPFVGDQLGDAAKAISRFSQQVYDAIATLGSVDEPAPSVLQNALFNALGPAGLNVLRDHGSDGLTAADILINAPGGTLSSNFSVDMHLQGSVAGPSTPLTFSTGLPGLPLKIETDGSIGISVNYDFELAFSYDATSHSISLDDTKRLGATDNQMAFAVSVGLQGFSATATMGFVQGTLSALPGETNSLTLAVGLNNLNSVPDVKVSGTAEANLQIDGSFAGTEGDFPGIDADLHLFWSIDSEDPSAAPPEISIENVYLDLGKFLTNVVKPVFEKIHLFTQPLAPILEVLGYPLPGLSDLSHLAGGDDVDLLDLGGVAALVTGFGPLYDLVHKVLNVIDKLNDFELGDTVRMKLGGFDLADFDLRNMASAVDPTNLNVRNLTDLSPSNLVGIAQSLAENIDQLPLSDEDKELIKGFAEQLNNGFSIQFPILEHPESAVFPLLLGRDSDLFTLDAEMHVSARGSVATGYSFFGVGIDFGGEVEIDTKFKFAYDTFGLRSLISDLADGNTSAEAIAEDIVAGFYVASGSYFTLAGDIYAGAGASIGVFSAVVGGFISTEDSGNEPVSVSINDPNQDGKLRFSEFGEDALNLEGKFSAAMGIEVRVGFEVFGKFVGIKKRFDIAQTILVNFDDDEPDPGAPILASQPDINGNINLYVGALAGERRNVNQTNGNERLRIQHVETTANGETIDISLRESLGGFEFDVTQRIFGVHSISGVGDQGDLTIDVLGGVTSDVHFEGGLGHADFIYDGTGAAYLEAGDLDSYLAGGLGNNTLVGLGGNDTISLGHAGNSVVGGGGSNTVIVTAPTAQGGTVTGGDTTDNQLVVISGDATTDINLGPDSPGAIRLSYNELTGGPYPNLILTRFNTVSVTAQDRATNIHIGELSGAGVQTVFVNIPVLGDGGRTIDLDTRDQLGVSDITLQPFEHNYSTSDGGTVLDHAMVMTNATTGVTTYLMGVAPDDVTTIVQHGGTATVGPLSNDNGTIVFDTSSRPTGQSEVVFMQTPALNDGNHIATSDGAGGEFVLDADLYPTIIFTGLTSIDQLQLKVLAPLQPSGINTVMLDASSLAGRLDVQLLGTGALNEASISELALGASIDVDGLDSSSKMNYGTGKLADVRGDVSAHNVEVTVNDANAVVPSLLVIGATELLRRANPDDGARPVFTYEGLHGTLTTHAGPGDRVGLDQTPAGIDRAVFTNPSLSQQDPLYVTAASADLALTGNWSLYLGRHMDPAGNVARTSQLTPIGVNVGLDYHGDGHTEVVLDAALDPVGALYSIHGLGVIVENQTVGLTVSAYGLALNDDVKLYLTGATVGITLPFLGSATFTIDGSDRFIGANPTGSNVINVEVPIGGVTLNPVGQYDSVLLTNDPIYILGSMPQDQLNVSIATSTMLSPSVSNPAVVFGYGTFLSDANYLANNPQLGAAWALGTQMFFYGQDVNLASFYDTIAPSLSTAHSEPNLPYSIYTSRTVGSLSYDQVWLNPSSHYAPPLPTDATSSAFFYQLNVAPVNSQMQMNASQLRGQLNITVTDPDYFDASPLAYYFDRLTEHIYQAGGAQGYTELPIPGPRYNVTFGQTYVNLTHVGAETTVSVQGVNNHPQQSNIPYYSRLLGGTITDPRVYVNVGAGDLSNINGNVAVNLAEVTIDGRNGTDSHILQLDGSSFSGWGTGASGGSLTATLGTLLGTLTIHGGAADSFSILNTPAGATAVSIVNNGPPAPAAMSMAMVAGDEPVAESMADPAATPAVYVAGKRVNQTLSVSGNFELYVGRRLNLNGSVDLLTDISPFTNTTNTFSNTDLQTITYNFAGEGLGKLVYDVASYLAFGPNLRVQSDAAYPSKGELGFRFGDNTYNKLVYSPNTELQIYGAQRSSLFVENTTTATIRYFTSIPPAQYEIVDNIQIWSAKGPVYINGRGNHTLVTVVPSQFSANDLRSTITADLYLSNVAMRIAPDTSTSPLPAAPNDIVLTSNTLTGLTGATIHFEQLADLVHTNFSNAGPGLEIGLPRNGASSMTIVDTPPGVTTHFTTVDNVPIGPVDIQGTTGALALAATLVSPNALQISDLNRREFRASSMHVGNGTLQSIQGNVYFASTSYIVPGGTVFDNHADIARDVRLGGNTADTTDNWAGLAPGRFYVNGFMNGSAITILGSPGSHYQINQAPKDLALMAGEGTTLKILDNTEPSGGGNLANGMSIFGAQQVTLNWPQNLSYVQGSSIYINPSPDRPNEITDLVADFIMYATEMNVDNAGNGLGYIWTGFSSSKTKLVTFQGSTTNLTLNGLNQDWGVNPTSYPIHVWDTIAHATTVNPGNRMVDVRGTTQPLSIEYDGQSTIVIGDAGNMQSILGDVTLNVHDAALPNVTVQLDDSAAATARSVVLGQSSPTNWSVSGLAPGSIQVTGARARLSLLAGSGDNTLIGPHTPSSWEITSTGGGTVNSTLTFAGMRNLTGGTASDDFYFRTGGQVAGNLNGGDGTDTAHYVSVLNGTETIDLEAGILPLVGGVASNIEAVDVVLPLVVQNPGNQIARIGQPITPLQINVTGGFAPHTYSATGLPTGLTIDPGTGIISGTPGSSISPGTNFNVNVTVNDSTGTQSVAFIWTVQDLWSIVNPGNQLTPEGVPISLQIQVDNPTNIPLRFVANGLPSYLSINSQTGLISGSIYFYTQLYGPNLNFNATVFAYNDATGQYKTVSFTWKLLQGFQLSSTLPYSYAGQAIDLPLLTNPYNHTITVSATGLPPGLSVDAQGHITGTIDDFAFSDQPYEVHLTGFDQTINYTATQTILWTIAPAVSVSVPSPVTSYAGTSVNVIVNITNPLDHQITVQATNLPPGVSIDQLGAITGTIDVGATSSPYPVTVTVTDVTVGRSVETTIDWTVLPAISLDDLNANTPPGTPTLAGVLDPMAGLYPNQLAAVTYPSSPEGAASIYFVAQQLWVLEDGQIRPVESIDPVYTTLDYPTQLTAVPGRGLVFFDNNSRVWFADQAGARVMAEGPVYYNNSDAPVILGDSLYFIAYDANFNAGVIYVDFSTGTPQVNWLNTAGLNSIESIRAFGGGLVYQATISGDSYRTAIWHDLQSDQFHEIGTASSFNDFTVAPAEDGSQNLFTLAQSEWGQPTELRAINSTALSAADPQLETLATFSAGASVGTGFYPAQPILVTGNQISFSVTRYDGETGEYSTQFWTSDGTASGTSGVSSFLVGYAQVDNQTVFDGSVYFFYQFYPSEVTESTVITQLWKFDSVGGELSLVHDFTGTGNYEQRPGALVAAGEFLYFSAANGLAEQAGLWRFKVGDAAPSLVPSKVGNAYANPNPSGGLLVGDRFYFSAASVALPDQYGSFSRQLWSVGAPEVVTVPGDFDGDGLVTASDIDSIWGLVQAGDPSADLNHDGMVNQADIDYLIHTILNTEYGDANLDGFVDAADLAETRKHIGQVFSGPNWADADFNGDGRSDAADLAVVRSHTGFASAPPASPASATPDSQPAATSPVVAQPVVALPENEIQNMKVTASVARIVREARPHSAMGPAISLLVTELDDITDLIAKATSGRRRKLMS